MGRSGHWRGIAGLATKVLETVSPFYEGKCPNDTKPDGTTNP